jgi:uncharacterized protein YndB with AHSA1/START domain
VVPLQLASYGGERAREIFLEPHVGGRFFERFVDGDELQVGSVVACEPPRRIAFTWSTADWDGETEVEVTFTPQPEGTRVDLDHRGFDRLGPVGAAVAAKFRGGWPGVLAAYAGRAEAAQGNWPRSWTRSRRPRWERPGPHRTPDTSG